MNAAALDFINSLRLGFSVRFAAFNRLSLADFRFFEGTLKP